jgi:DNA-binding SARP family transcriptional activator
MGHRLEILGPPSVLDTDTLRRVELPLGKPLGVLCYLVVERRPVPREELGRLLWSGSAEPKARHSVRQALWLLRRTLGEDALVGDDPVAASAMLTSDLWMFEEALRGGELDAARALWRGPLLSGLQFPECKEWDLWLEERQELLRARFFQALLEQGRLLKEQGREEESVPPLEEALALNPYSLTARALHFDSLVNLRRMSPARDALEAARREVGDHDGAVAELARMEARLAHASRHGRREEPELLGEAMEFVGRSGELADLRGLWRRTLGGRTAVASLAGPTGIGKSRLAREFLAGVEEEGGRVAQVRGFKGEHKIPWGTVADLVRGLMALPGAAGVSSASDSLLRSLLPSLAGNGSGAAASPPHPAAMADAVTDLLEAVGFEGTLALFVDDFQWVDPQSRALLAHVVRSVRSTPLFLLVAERTGDRLQHREPHAEALVGEVGGRKIRLGPLGPEEIRELLALLCEFSHPDEAGDLVAEIHRVSGGNPLFIGELLRKLAEEGVCRFEEGRWILDGERFPKALSLPESIQSLIEERLERISPVAAQVVAALAQERRSVPARLLRLRSGLEEGPFARALGELVGREVVAWVSGDDLDFLHDQLREAAALRFNSAQGSRARRWIRRPRSLAGAAVGLALAVLGVSGVLARLRVDPRPAGPAFPYGEGRFFYQGDTTLSVAPPDREGGAWRVEPVDFWVPGVHYGLQEGPFPGRGGEVRWFGWAREGEAPPFAAEFLPDGTVREIHRIKGDAGVLDLSPDGRSVLLMSEDTLAPRYAQELLLLDLVSGAKETLYRVPEMMRRIRWSPDGTRIALLFRSRVDTLVLLTPEGRVVQRRAFPEVESVSDLNWCQDGRHLLMDTRDFGERRGVLIDLDDPTAWRVLGEGFRATLGHTCVAAGRGDLFLALVDEGWMLHFLDFATGKSTRLFPEPLAVAYPLRWLPRRPVVPFRSVRVSGGPLELPFAGQGLLALEGTRWDGSKEEVAARWWSEDPSIASVRGAGRVTGNRAGTTVVVGEYADWLRDSVSVTVFDDGEAPAEVLFREDFDRPDLPAWEVHADPEPRVTVLEGRPALELRGDGRYRDYLQTGASYSLARGVTLEMEFRLRLTRTDRQHVALCLLEETPSGIRLARQGERRFCFRYPYEENVKLRDDLGLVRAGDRDVDRPVDVSRWLPSDGWTHLALQIRPDGTASVFLDRELVERSEFQIGVDPESRWLVDLAGFAVDTRPTSATWSCGGGSASDPPLPPLGEAELAQEEDEEGGAGQRGREAEDAARGHDATELA